MPERRHQGDTRTYRELPTHKERVQSFTATLQNLVDYVRVQTEMDVTAEHTAADIIAARINQLERAIERVRTLA